AGATAMVDTSDGLIADLAHVAVASCVGIDLRIERLEVHQRLVDVGSALGVDPLRWVLTGGEDYALAATFPSPAAVPEGWRTVGTVVPGDGVTVNGEPYDGGGGWEHFRGN
ncbi:MAG: thiamine-phosphate kinase, partial [Sciscionella sp.]